MSDSEQFRHDRSAYERPNQPFVCGRAARWGKPCGRGPNPDGSCGGTVECVPFNKDGRFECRRPGSAGGPCATGPLPDGRCGRTMPPCAPVPSLRRLRGRLAILGFALTLALVVVLAKIPSDQAGALASRNPGPLSAAHGAFDMGGGCGTCHAPHRDGLGAWVPAFFAAADVSERCTGCHAFAGPADAAHNTLFVNGRSLSVSASRSDLSGVSCVGCHTEHHGRDADIAQISDRACASCHDIPDHHYPRRREAGAAAYPYLSRTAINFDHTVHLQKHFVDARYQDKAPQGCVACHDVAAGGQPVEMAGFDRSCAACHGDALTKQGLALVTAPELSDKGLGALKKRRGALRGACGWGPEKGGDGAYDLAVSFDTPSALNTFFLGVDGSDSDAYSVPFADLITAMAGNGTRPIAELVAAKFGTDAVPRLLSGLNPEIAKRVACDWAANLEYEAPDDQGQGGWAGSATALVYRATGHADPVIRAWFDAAAGLPVEDDDAAAVDEIRSDWLRPDGPGACIKCHAVGRTSPGASGPENGPIAIAWTPRGGAGGPHTVFDHRPHIGVAGDCAACHTLDPGADYAASFKTWDATKFISNFKPMDTETCVSCHRAGRVGDDCQLCHRYHLEPTVKVRQTAAASGKALPAPVEEDGSPRGDEAQDGHAAGKDGNGGTP